MPKTAEQNTPSPIQIEFTRKLGAGGFDWRVINPNKGTRHRFSTDTDGTNLWKYDGCGWSRIDRTFKIPDTWEAALPIIQAYFDKKQG